MQTNPTRQIDIDGLRARFNDRRSSTGTSLARIADQTGISKSALFNFEHGKVTPDTDTIIALQGWMRDGHPLAPGAVTARPKDTLRAILDVIADDTTVSTHAREILCELMAVAYRGFLEQQQFDERGTD
jgi:transcriptional regulator with XRE-family HTH domain